MERNLSGKIRELFQEKKATLLKTAVFVAAIALYAIFSGKLLSTNVLRYLLQIFLYIALGEAWNLLSGFAGMTSLGQQLYIGIAGYAVAVMTTLYGKSPASGIAVGLLCAMILSVVIVFALFRVNGMFFSIASWVIAEAAEKLFLNWKLVNQGAGMTIRISPYPGIKELHLIAFFVCLLSVLLVVFLMKSRIGLSLTAMRDDPQAARTIGISLIKKRLIVSLIAAMLCALAGSIFFINKGTIYPDSGFSTGWTISLVFICIIGGSGTILGPVVGSVLYVFLKEFLAHYPGWSNLILGLITIVIVLFFPRGIIGTLQRKISFRLFSTERKPPAKNAFHE